MSPERDPTFPEQDSGAPTTSPERGTAPEEPSASRPSPPEDPSSSSGDAPAGERPSLADAARDRAADEKPGEEQSDEGGPAVPDLSSGLSESNPAQGL